MVPEVTVFGLCFPVPPHPHYGLQRGRPPAPAPAKHLDVTTRPHSNNENIAFDSELL